MAKRWGLLCPEGDGLLLERDEWTAQGVAWCPSNDTHGGNGRFFRRQEVVEGWFDPDRPRALTPEQATKQAEMQERARQRQEEWRMATTAKSKPVKVTAEKAPRVRAAKEPKECLCGCGGMTKGGRFLPGHDARYHAAQKKAAAAAAGEQSEAAAAEDQPL